MVRASELRLRDVVNVRDGRRLGLIKDLELDVENGKVKAIILPGATRLLGLLGRAEDVVIPWEQIKRLGVDVILVELEGFVEPVHTKR
ncbi:MAG: YlmC/YmxH family sporulation protein [Clostridia bacterium]|jgi:YlmC/YmxH family sporulation protein|nr:YlmC/YmxH family sporulation protein [Clostridia bacterium]MDH7573289.1 YlmC/YmxH family sporulation protein [Clostridia bacterium]